MKRIILSLVSLLIVDLCLWCLAGCEPQTELGPSRAVKAAIDEGYKNVEEGGPVWFECAKDDSAFMSRYITATNVNGVPVKLMACCGLVKGCTIRHQ